MRRGPVQRRRSAIYKTCSFGSSSPISSKDAVLFDMFVRLSVRYVSFQTPLPHTSHRRYVFFSLSVLLMTASPSVSLPHSHPPQTSTVTPSNPAPASRKTQRYSRRVYTHDLSLVPYILYTGAYSDVHAYI